MAKKLSELICRICEQDKPKLIPILIPKYKPLINKYLACANVTVCIVYNIYLLLVLKKCKFNLTISV